MGQGRWAGWKRKGAGTLQEVLRAGAIVLATTVLAGMVQVSFPGAAVQARQVEGSPGAGANPLAGTWHQVVPAQAGGVIHNFMSFGVDGTFFSTSINEGGGLNVNGMRTQMWGRYTIKPAGNGLYEVVMNYAGRLPQQLCMQGFGCRSMGPGPQHPDRGMFEFQGDMFQSNIGFAGQRSGIPPVLLQRLPASWMLQPPPPMDIPSGGGGRSGSATKIPGLGGNCDDLQQSRICTVNDGWYHKDSNTGCMVCTKY